MGGREEPGRQDACWEGVLPLLGPVPQDCSFQPGIPAQGSEKEKEKGQNEREERKTERESRKERERTALTHKTSVSQFSDVSLRLGCFDILISYHNYGQTNGWTVNYEY